MGFYRGPKIVTDGLLVYLDAANVNSYKGTTVWYNLSGNQNNGSIINGPTYNASNKGSIVFDGINDYVQGPVNCNKTYYSVDWWIYPYSTTNYNQSIYISDINNTGWTGFTVHTTTTGSCYIGTSVSSRISPWRNNVFVPNVWQNFTWTFNNGQSKFYKNGVLEVSATLALSNLSSFLTFGIGYNGGNTINGRISNFKLYSNKVLTQAEITQNYDAIKNRFI